jgi:hypothetical protein
VWGCRWTRGYGHNSAAKAGDCRHGQAGQPPRPPPARPGSSGRARPR